MRSTGAVPATGGDEVAQSWKTTVVRTIVGRGHPDRESLIQFGDACFVRRGGRGVPLTVQPNAGCPPHRRAGLLVDSGPTAGFLSRLRGAQAPSSTPRADAAA